MKTFLTILLTIGLCIQLNSQIYVSAFAGLYDNVLKGGFTGTIENPTTNIYAGLQGSHQLSRFFGYSLEYTTGRKSYSLGYPTYPTGLTYINFGYRVTGFSFWFNQLSPTFTFFGGRWFRFHLGPYFSLINRDDYVGLGVDPNFYYPAYPVDMYKRLEFGAQTGIDLHIPIGKRFFISGYGRIGGSLNDLRKNNWEGAYSNFLGFKMDWPSTDVNSRFIAYGLGLGYTFLPDIRKVNPVEK